MPRDEFGPLTSSLFRTLHRTFPLQHGPAIKTGFGQQREDLAEIHLAIAERAKPSRTIGPRLVSPVFLAALGSGALQPGKANFPRTKASFWREIRSSAFASQYRLCSTSLSAPPSRRKQLQVDGGLRRDIEQCLTASFVPRSSRFRVHCRLLRALLPRLLPTRLRCLL